MFPPIACAMKKFAVIIEEIEESRQTWVNYAILISHYLWSIFCTLYNSLLCILIMILIMICKFDHIQYILFNFKIIHILLFENY